MDMTIFQIESNKITPKKGSLLISAPFLRDYFFARSVVLTLHHNDEGSMGIALNKKFNNLRTLNGLMPELGNLPPIPLYKGGPIDTDTLFYLHNLDFLKDSLPMGNGLYLNGNFEDMKRYLLNGGPVSGHIKFFMGYAGWQKGQLMQEIENNTWIVSEKYETDILHSSNGLWQKALYDMGGKFAVWSRYPQYPFMN